MASTREQDPAAQEAPKGAQGKPHADEGIEYWNKRASSFAKSCGKGAYAQSFVERLQLEPGQSVFDMGCGSGTIAIPVAQAGHEVLACDFAPGMIEQLVLANNELGLSIDTKIMAWEDDWAACGLEEKSFDVAVASRSFRFDDQERGIEQLEWIAREKVAVTVGASRPPFVDERLLEFMGRPVPAMKVNMGFVNLLADKGRCPSVSYLGHMRNPSQATLEDLSKDLRRALGPDPLSAEEEKRLSSYVEQHAVSVDDDDGPRVRLDYANEMRWMMVVWRPDGNPA